MIQRRSQGDWFALSRSTKNRIIRHRLSNLQSSQRLTLSFFHLPNIESHACPRLETSPTRRRHRGVHADPHLSLRMTSLWLRSNCFAGINVHLASATRLLATPERNGRSSTIVVASHRASSTAARSVCLLLDPRSNGVPTERRRSIIGGQKDS